jgi:hypothetical protein
VVSTIPIMQEETSNSQQMSMREKSLMALAVIFYKISVFTEQT